MIEIILNPGEISSHSHAEESISILKQGSAKIAFNDIDEFMELDKCYNIPKEILHTMINYGEEITRIMCTGHSVDVE